MKIIVENSPPLAVLKPGDVVTPRQAASVMEWKNFDEVFRCLNSARFRSRGGRYVFRRELEFEDPAVEVIAGSVLSDLRRQWLDEKRERGDPITGRVLLDMGFTKLEIAALLRRRERRPGIRRDPVGGELLSKELNDH